MNTFSQWVHQHDLLLLCGAVLTVIALLLGYLRLRLRWWLGWFGGVALVCVAAVALRTPAASVYDHEDRPVTSDLLADVEEATSLPAIYSEPDFTSVEAIEKTLAESGKPTLVEFYTDYGIS
jgi:hypothetical protein